MRPIRLLLIFFVAVFVGGALLAPGLYALARAGADHFPSLTSLAGQPFHRFVARSCLGLAVIGLWPLLRALGLASRQELGLRGPRKLKNLGLGFLLGFGSLAVVAALDVASGARAFNLAHPAAEIAKQVFGAVLTAVIVAVLEEILFRGALYGGLRKTLLWPVALLISSALYASLHFLGRAEMTGDMHWYSGLAILPAMLQGLVDPAQLVPAFFTLTVAGLILGLSYQRTGTLYLSMGLHAGWIFWLKFYKFITMPGPHAPASIWGTDKFIDGWVAVSILAGVLVLVAVWPIHQKGGGTWR